MDKLTTEEINSIRSSVDIVDIISKYIPLVQKGKNYFGVCPFHDDHSPSMSVSKDKQIYTCFSCGATGNVFKFLMDYENISFMEAVKMIADIGGISIDISVAKNKNYKSNKELYEIYATSLKFYQNNLNTEAGLKAKEYLKDRSIDEELVKVFKIGLSLKKRNLLTKLLLKKEYKEKDLIDSGLLVKSDYGLNDIYVNRIMFPLYNISGEVVGYSGRIYDGIDSSKYINTKETEIFKKGELLYNYHLAKDECRHKNQVIIMEGFMDVIRAYSVGIKNVVATMGTAVTKQQALLIKKLAKEVILCFDGDSAGEKATMACSNELMSIGITPKIIRLEDNLDPDDYIKKFGFDRFNNKIEYPMNVMDFKLLYLKEKRNLDDSEDTASYVNDIIKELNKIDDDILKEITLKKISEESNLDIEFLRSKLENKKIVKEKPRQVKIEITKTNKYKKAECFLLNYMLKHVEVIKFCSSKMPYLPTREYRELGRLMLLYYKQYGYINEVDFMSYLINKGSDLIDIISRINTYQLKEEYTLDEINDYINVIQEGNIKNECEKLKLQLKDTNDSTKKAEIGQRIVELKKVRGEENA